MINKEKARLIITRTNWQEIIGQSETQECIDRFETIEEWSYYRQALENISVEFSFLEDLDEDHFKN